MYATYIHSSLSAYQLSACLVMLNVQLKAFPAIVIRILSLSLSLDNCCLPLVDVLDGSGAPLFELSK